MKIGFTGTQRGMTTSQYKMVMNILDVYSEKITEIHHGDCIGADRDFHDISTKISLKSILHPPLNEYKRAFCNADIVLPKKDYLDRNHDIVDETDLLIATPGENFEVLRSGTWATIRYSKKKQKKVIIIYPDGKVHF